MAAPGAFHIGGPGVTEIPTVCPAPFDKGGRQELEKLEHGISTLPSRFNLAAQIALTEMQIGMVEYDDVRLSRATELVRQLPDPKHNQWAILLAELQQAWIRQDIASFSAKRHDIEALIDSISHVGALDMLRSRPSLIGALAREASGVGGAAGGSLRDNALRRSSDLLVVAQQYGSPDDNREILRVMLTIKVDKAWLDRDAAALAKYVDEARVALDTPMNPTERLEQLHVLMSALFTHAFIARGEEGLRDLEELQHRIDEATVLVAASPLRTMGVPTAPSQALQGVGSHWVINGANANTPCYQQALLDYRQARTILLQQSLQAGKVQPDPTAVGRATSLLGRVQTALSLQPVVLKPMTLQLAYGWAYILGAQAEPSGHRDAWLDRASASLDAGEQGLQTCFCADDHDAFARARKQLLAVSR